MNAIDYIADGQSVQFSKKAVTINGEEFAYIGMSAIKHSAAKKIYLFKYEDKWHKLSYNEEDAQKIKTLFSRIAELNAKRAAHAAAEAKPVETPAPAKLDVKSIMEHRDEVVLEPVDTKAEEIASIAEAIESGAEETVQKVVETPVEVAAPAEEPVAEVTEEAAPAEAEAAEVPAEPAEIAAEAEETAEEPTDDVAEAIKEMTADVAETPEVVEEKAEETAEEADAVPEEKGEILPPDEKKAKLKKAFIIFAAVICLFIILAVVYFFVVGTSNNPNVGPNSNETQQYDDIDGLIEDLQND